MADFDQVKAQVAGHLGDLARQLCNFHLKIKKKQHMYFHN